MSPGSSTESYPAFARIGLRENPGKTSTRPERVKQGLNHVADDDDDVKKSPDLNPIEHLWDELRRRLRSRDMLPTSIVQLSAMLQEQWRHIPMDILHKPVESMPDRVTAVIATRSDSTTF
ncbi:hypothetical protein ANN_06441 [Periplaneta americana]|uniref:Uncharacterized protein n=1 Tax=Periplaneta americana TaxID=6978 RepID=A0ABQ8TG20_PERAM|nr:hypothetical protein ANN_06441 [Periplaneta americana]